MHSAFSPAAPSEDLVITGIGAVSTIIAGQPNLESTEEASSRLNISRHSRPATISTILCNAAGLGGVNASLVLRSGHAK